MTTEYDETNAATPAELNKHVKRVEAENKALRAQVLSGHLNQLGLDPGKGLGKAVAKEYAGGYSYEEVAAYVQDEYQHSPPPASTPEEAPTSEVPVSAAEAAEATLDTVESQSTSSTPPPQVDVVEEAEAKMLDPESTRQDAKNSAQTKVARYMETITP